MFASFSDSHARNKIIILVGALLILVGISGYFVVLDSQKRLIENQTLQVAEIVARQVTTSRSVYIDFVAEHKQRKSVDSWSEYHNDPDSLPHGALFVKEVADQASSNSQGLYKYRSISKWNVSESKGLNMDFLRTAWLELEKQDQANPKGPIDWKPTHAIQEVDGKESLFYLKATSASDASCLACHNAIESTHNIAQRRISEGTEPYKTWKLHQLMGATFIEIPIESMKTIAFSESTQSMIWIVAILTGGLFLLAYFLLKDVTKARNITQKLLWQSQHDNLTQLPNMKYFHKEATRLINQSKSNNETHALCFLDLDQFKVVNDTLGHSVGDELLRKICAELQEEVDPTHMLARLGGDEFGILLNNYSIEDAFIFSQKLCNKIKNYHFVWEDKPFDIGVSIGVVEINKDSTNTDSVIKCADLACYKAKESGRNCAEIYIEDDKKIALRKGEMSWASRILKALEDKRIVIYSQEIASMSEEIPHKHYEVLVRLLDEHGNTISPNEFLPAAERYNLMTKLDLAIIDLALCALSKNQFSNLGETGFISINLSGQSLSNERFLKKVNSLIHKHEVDPTQICFEITESSAISNPQLVKQFMTEMKTLGIRFALDDFGTGLSSLTYLKQFPVDYLKIDGSFISDIQTNAIDRTLVDAVNKMAHTMGLKTVAEYVESAEIFDILKKLNVDYSQGYFIGKPKEVK